MTAAGSTDAIEVRFGGDLPDLVGEERVTIPAGERRSAKDLVESLGVPHTEVARIDVDGVAAGFDAQVVGGELVVVEPVATVAAAPLQPDPPSPVRFIADVHLGRLAELLRFVGVDTRYRNDATDDELVEVAEDEDRVLVSRDRGLLKRSAVTHGFLVRSTDPETQLVEVLDRYDLRARLTPFSRCMRCNGPLEAVAKREIIDRLEPGTRREHDRFVRCASCAQLYWPGSHHDRLRDIAEIATGPEGPGAHR